MKSTVEQIRRRFDNDVERFSNLETGQTATIDAPLVLELITQAAAEVTPHAARLLDTIESELDGWSTRAPERGELHDLARRRLAQLPARRPRNLLTSIGRLTEQKAALFLQSLPDGSVALDRILENLGNDVLIMVGSGDREMERRMADVAGRNRNLLFLCGYSETFTELLYKAGDLFLMPSSFEPCGISQMLAMRDLQPCVVHAVGGLKDTVQDGVNGFSFTGDSPAEQAQNFVAKVAGALALKDSMVRTIPPFTMVLVVLLVYCGIVGIVPYA